MRKTCSCCCGCRKPEAWDDRDDCARLQHVLETHESLLEDVVGGELLPASVRSRIEASWPGTSDDFRQLRAKVAGQCSNPGGPLVTHGLRDEDLLAKYVVAARHARGVNLRDPASVRLALRAVSIVTGSAVRALDTGWRIPEFTDVVLLCLEPPVRRSGCGCGAGCRDGHDGRPGYWRKSVSDSLCC